MEWTCIARANGEREVTAGNRDEEGKKTRKETAFYFLDPLKSHCTLRNKFEFNQIFKSFAVNAVKSVVNITD
eukprot:766428-Hanusia_phi.AAC.4